MAAVSAELQRWLTLQAQMRDLGQTEAWDAFVATTAVRRQEALEDLLGQGSTKHDFNAGFIAGLDWITQYPGFVVDYVDKYRAQLPAAPAPIVP